MKQILLAVVLLLPSGAFAQTISPDGCNVLAQSAEDASAAISGTVAKASSDAMVAVMPKLPIDGQRAADKVEKARLAVLGPMRDYAAAMTEFAKVMRVCAGN